MIFKAQKVTKLERYPWSLSKASVGMIAEIK